MKEENQTIIKALNMYGRVPEQWELLNEIERLNNIIDKTNWWLKEMLKTATNDETKAIINGVLELLLKEQE